MGGRACVVSVIFLTPNVKNRANPRIREKNWPINWRIAEMAQPRGLIRESANPRNFSNLYIYKRRSKKKREKPYFYFVLSFLEIMADCQIGGLAPAP